jgi:thermostable 8-oxoguanine DNA glycosylase
MTGKYLHMFIINKHSLFFLKLVDSMDAEPIDIGDKLYLYSMCIMKELCFWFTICPQNSNSDNLLGPQCIFIV